MSKNRYSGKEEYIDYEDGIRVRLAEDDSPPFTETQFRHAKAMKEALPEVMKAFKRGAGRPRTGSPKVHIGMRLDADVVDWLRSKDGYNGIVNETLRRKMQREQRQNP